MTDGHEATLGVKLLMHGACFFQWILTIAVNSLNTTTLQCINTVQHHTTAQQYHWPSFTESHLSDLPQSIIWMENVARGQKPIDLEGLYLWHPVQTFSIACLHVFFVH